MKSVSRIRYSMVGKDKIPASIPALIHSLSLGSEREYFDTAQSLGSRYLTGHARWKVAIGNAQCRQAADHYKLVEPADVADRTQHAVYVFEVHGVVSGVVKGVF